MAREPNCRDCKYFEDDVDFAWPICNYHQFHFEDDFSPCSSFVSRRAGGSTSSGGSDSSALGGCGCLVLIVLLVMGLFGGAGIFQSSRQSTAEPEPPSVEDQEPVEEASTGYLLPTDTAYITEEDLAGYTKEEVSLIRNEIFARHGCTFRNETIRTYFEGQSWYVPVPEINSSNFDPALFNDFESQNLATILAYESRMGWRT